MRINVTQRDIDMGRKADPLLCPIARAVRRHDVYKSALVCTWSLSLSFNSDMRIDLPAKVSSFIQRYDAHGKVQPFTFTMPDRPPVD